MRVGINLEFSCAWGAPCFSCQKKFNFLKFLLQIFIFIFYTINRNERIRSYFRLRLLAEWLRTVVSFLLYFSISSVHWFEPDQKSFISAHFVEQCIFSFLFFIFMNTWLYDDQVFSFFLWKIVLAPGFVLSL